MNERFTVEETDSGLVIFDDEFGWDAMIKVHGDFYGPDKRWFLEAIASALNKTTIPTRREWEQLNPELAKSIMAGPVA
jgi:hypothetical protein